MPAPRSTRSRPYVIGLPPGERPGRLRVQSPDAPCPRRSTPPWMLHARPWTPGYARWSPGTSIPETGCPSGSSARAKLGWDPRREIRGYDDLDRFGFFEDEWLRGGPVRRWVPKGYAGQADLRLRDRRQHGRAEVADQHRRLPHRLRDVQRHAAGRRLSEGRGLAVDRPQRAAPSAPRRRAPGAVSAAASASWSTSTRAG